jgi:hypothetical protein
MLKFQNIMNILRVDHVWPLFGKEALVRIQTKLKLADIDCLIIWLEIRYASYN